MAQNTNVTIKSSATTTVTGNSADLVNRDCRGIVLHVKVTGEPTGTTPTCVVKLQAKNRAGNYVDIAGAATASITAAGTSTLVVSPGVATSANATVALPLPRVYRAVWTLGGTTPSFVLGIEGLLVL